MKEGITTSNNLPTNTYRLLLTGGTYSTLLLTGGTYSTNGMIKKEKEGKDFNIIHITYQHLQTMLTGDTYPTYRTTQEEKKQRDYTHITYLLTLMGSYLQVVLTLLTKRYRTRYTTNTYRLLLTGHILYLLDDGGGDAHFDQCQEEVPRGGRGLVP